MTRWERMAWEIANQLPDRTGARLLVGSCWHGRGFTFFNELARAVSPHATVCLGDLSGLDPFGIDSIVVQWAWDVPGPVVYCPGNHDSELVLTVMQNKGAVALDRPRLINLNGLRIWGWPDPNRTRWGRRDRYDPGLCRASVPPVPDMEEPYLIAVHSTSMVPPHRPGVRLALIGHTHVPGVWERDGTLFARTGTAGGGGLNWPGRITPRQAMVADVKLPEHRAEAVWFVESDGMTVSLTEAISVPSRPRSSGGSDGNGYGTPSA